MTNTTNTTKTASEIKTENAHAIAREDEARKANPFARVNDQRGWSRDEARLVPDRACRAATVVLSIECPRCGVPAGGYCFTHGGVHVDRINAAL